MNGKIWEEKDIEYLRENYSNTAILELAKYFNCSVKRVSNKAWKLGLKKDKDFLIEMFRKNVDDPNHSSRKYRFKKGHTPFNKGKRQVDFMTQEAIERTKGTRFNKGQKAWNRKPVGYERITKDNYIEVKVAEPNVFKLKHRVLWEKHNGTIPKGHNVQFKDGNRQNISIDNLYLISKSEQLKKQNSMHVRYPKEVQLAIQMKGALNRQINKLKNKNTKN